MIVSPGGNQLPLAIVGGGPVGMTAAVALARQNIPVVVVEAEPVAKTDWRASTFHPPTLELLRELGVVDRMHAEGLAVPRYQFRDRRAGLVAEFDFGLLRDETSYPYRLQLNQQHLVRMLAGVLEDLPSADVRFGCRAVAVEPAEDSVTLTVETADGVERLRCAYLIGADGASSTVRSLLGIDFDGFTYPERFLIASTPVDIRELLPDIADVNYIADPEEWLFLLRTPESWRAVYPVPSGQTREQAVDLDEIQSHLQGIAPYAPGYPIEDFQLYNVHQRVASTFRQGNCLLIGDAAHINSPLGGVGLNSGIHDAMDLTRRLVRILRHGADPDAELDLFAEVRRRVAVEYVQADTRRNTERLNERDEAKRQAQHAEMRAIAGDVDRARAWCRRASLLESVHEFGIGKPPGGDGRARVGLPAGAPATGHRGS
ncbi:FAD-dependent monooxygenase [Plantactinospora sp. S1510]|uniref:FAD-dependent monooxygenase n=1 Tax=Plantactinospora alkalitolerans TaxID=2789879 RepID=A0ABS0GSG6_9ACTN|nr:NAD(P)/FAD-dependent oxidoreductase [Plantactinospora alkalitolerans]MBF9128832.1 FAD-dependent monooxygenase [Plantactinospora alkalitolerans]